MDKPHFKIRLILKFLDGYEINWELGLLSSLSRRRHRRFLLASLVLFFFPRPTEAAPPKAGFTLQAEDGFLRRMMSNASGRQPSGMRIEKPPPSENSEFPTLLGETETDVDVRRRHRKKRALLSGSSSSLADPVAFITVGFEKGCVHRRSDHFAILIEQIFLTCEY